MNTDKKFTLVDKIGLTLAVTLLVAIPIAKVWATCTYDTSHESFGTGYTIASCNETTEAAPTLATQGKPLAGSTGLTITVVATGNMTAGGKLNAYLYHQAVGQWTRAPDLDLTISAAATNQTWPGFMVTVPQGRIDYRTSAAGANNTLIYLIGGK